MSGYQSNTNLQALVLAGDFPIEHSLGGYGVANNQVIEGDEGGDFQYFTLHLNPPISTYRVGMHLQVRFDTENMGEVMLEVDDNGLVPLVKLSEEELSDLEAGDINTTNIYGLIYDGEYFQVVSGIYTGASEVFQATQNFAGIAEIATQAETLGGVDDARMVTPLKLTDLLDQRSATEDQTGLAQIATQDEVDAGTDNHSIVTPLRLEGRLSTLLADLESNLGNVLLFANYMTYEGSPETDEVDFGESYTLPAGTLASGEALEINVSGDIQGGAGNKTLRMYFGDERIFEYTTDTIGPWFIQIVVGRAYANETVKGSASIMHHGVAPHVQIVQTPLLEINTEDHLIRMTHQNEMGGVGQLNRFTFLIRKIM